MKKVFLVGNLTNDPASTMIGTRNVVHVNIAVNQYRRDETPDYFRLSIWNQRDGDFAMKYLKKGSRVAVSGDIRLTTYKGNDGGMRSSLNVDVDSIEGIGGGGGGAGGSGAGADDSGSAGGGYDAAPATGGNAGGDDDLPF